MKRALFGALVTALALGSESRLYCWRPGTDGWRLMADLSAHGIAGITRLAVDPAGRRLALVGDETP